MNLTPVALTMVAGAEGESEGRKADARAGSTCGPYNAAGLN